MENINAVMMDIVCCVNHIHFLSLLFSLFFESISINSQFPYVLCYNVLCDFVSLIFPLSGS